MNICPDSAYLSLHSSKRETLKEEREDNLKTTLFRF